MDAQQSNQRFQLEHVFNVKDKGDPRAEFLEHRLIERSRPRHRRRFWHRPNGYSSPGRQRRQSLHYWTHKGKAGPGG